MIRMPRLEPQSSAGDEAGDETTLLRPDLSGISLPLGSKPKIDKDQNSKNHLPIRSNSFQFVRTCTIF